MTDISLSRTKIAIFRITLSIAWARTSLEDPQLGSFGVCRPPGVGRAVSAAGGERLIRRLVELRPRGVREPLLAEKAIDSANWARHVNSQGP